MTLHGWDASHYDGRLTTAVLARARAEGVVFFTHKVGEGLSDTEGTLDDTALAAARDVGIPFVGGYVVPRSLDSAAQIEYWWRLLNAGEPWWRDFPGWFNQVDLERWPYDNVSAAKGIDCAKRWRDKTGRQTILYASHGQYGDSLSDWDGPLWNADYTSRPAADIAAMYPGDDWQPLHGTWRGGWAPYSGKAPTVLQYTSSATIAGLTTCDGNAFRGTESDFARMIMGSNPKAGEDTVITLVRGLGDPTVWRAEGGMRTAIPSEQHLADIRYQSGQGAIAPLANGGQVMEVGNLDAFGIAYPPAIGGAQPGGTLSDAQLAGLEAKLSAKVPTAADMVDELIRRGSAKPAA